MSGDPVLNSTEPSLLSSEAHILIPGLLFLPQFRVIIREFRGFFIISALTAHP